MVLPKAVVNINAVAKQDSIIGIGALIDHDASIEEFCHINTGAIVNAGCTVNKLSKIDTGVVYTGKQFNQEYIFKVGI